MGKKAAPAIVMALGNGNANHVCPICGHGWLTLQQGTVACPKCEADLFLEILVSVSYRTTQAEVGDE